jgi:iron-sulfur cluster assembly protein
VAITLSESAARRVQNHIAQRGKGLGLRLGVKSSGCTGFSYVLDYAEETRADDLVFENHGVKVYVDPASLPMLDGTRVDFVRQGLNEQFKFENPNVKDQCGCGESFSV